MSESGTHRRIKNQLAGKTGWVEVELPSGRRMDALSRTGIGSEVERGGVPGIRKSVGTLKEALETYNARKVRMVVPNGDMEIAAQEMRRQRVGGDVENLSGTQAWYVRKRTTARR